MMAPNGTEQSRLTPAELNAPDAAGQRWQCEHCGASFASLFAAIAHVEVKHPRRERGRGVLT